MLATATALIDAVGNSIIDEEIMHEARFLYHARNEMDNEEFAKALYLYSGAVASMAADKVTKVLLTKTQLIELMLACDEMEKMRNSVLEENNGK